MYKQTNIALAPDLKMSEIIQHNPYLILLLEHFGINSILQDKSIKEVCEEIELNTDLFLTFANLYNGNKHKLSFSFSFNNTNSILDYLKNNHKYYLKEIYPSILSTIKKVANINKQKEVEMLELFFIEYFNEVIEHLEYENKVVFPYILNLYKQIESKKYNPKDSDYSVKVYKDHHNNIEEKLTDLKNLLIKYLPYDNDHTIRRELLFKLFELEYDVNIHSKIEDSLLIPLVSNMEDHLKDANKQ